MRSSKIFKAEIMSESEISGHISPFNRKCDIKKGPVGLYQEILCYVNILLKFHSTHV